MTFRILVLGGDGIGPEVIDAAVSVLDAIAPSLPFHYTLDEDVLHGAAWTRYGTFIRPQTLERARAADAILVGATGGPEWDHIVVEGGPAEQDGLMKLRAELDTYVGLRPARAWEPLLDHTPFRRERIAGADLIVLREMCGGAMFTRTRGIESVAPDSRRAFDLNEYSDTEIERVARAAFELARRRRGRLVSVDKSNVLMAGKLWREIVETVSTDFPDVTLTHWFADNCAYQLCLQPNAMDVILGDNLFGDILSDQAAAISGSLGMLPSASLPGLPARGAPCGPAIYEPVHGSAPDIAGQGIANPLAAILSLAMLLEYSAGLGVASRRIEAAVNATLAEGILPPDLGGRASTREVTNAVIRHFFEQ